MRYSLDGAEGVGIGRVIGTEMEQQKRAVKLLTLRRVGWVGAMGGFR